jgi:hypothetical protein
METLPMTTDFEQQLELMLPVMQMPSPKAVPSVRLQSFAKIAAGFLLGVFVTYYCMQPSDTAHRPQPQESFMLVFDDTNIENFRRPADLLRSVTRVPVPKVEIDIDQTQWQYGTMRNNLLRL